MDAAIAYLLAAVVAFCTLMTWKNVWAIDKAMSDAVFIIEELLSRQRRQAEFIQSLIDEIGELKTKGGE